MESEHLSFCRICAAACGMVVTVDGDRVTRVRGDMDHPISRGYVCTKGRGLPEWHHRHDRLDRPRVDQRDVGWDVALDHLGGRLGEVIDSSGADAVGLYLATGLAYDSAGQIAAGMFMRSIGSSSFYTAATVDNAPVLVAAELVTGNAMLNPVWEPEHAGLLILVGTNPVVSHGYGTTLPDPVRRLRDFRGIGGRIWVVDPRRTETATLADEHIAVRPGADVALLAAVAREIVGDAEPSPGCSIDDIAALRSALDPFTIDRAAADAGIDASVIQRLIAEVREHRGRLAVFCGTGTTMARDGILAEWLRWVLLVVTDSLDRPGGMRFNRGVVNRPRAPRPGAPVPTALPGPGSRPDLPRVAGQIPAVALVDEIESGRLRALVVTGGNPLTALPEPERVRAALASLEVLVVIDVLDGDLAALATHVLPATGQLERADLTLAEHVSIRSGVQYTPAVVPPVAERRPTWWMLAEIARRLGSSLFAGLVDEAELAGLTDDGVLRALLAHAPLDGADVLAAGPRGIDLAIEYGWVRGTMLSDGRWRIAPEVLLARLAAHRTVDHGSMSLQMIPRREMARSNSVRCAADGGRAVVRLNGDDAFAAGLADGDHVVVTSAHGELVASVAIDDHVRRGVVSVTHGHPGSNPGALTSASIDVDPLTTMPLASGVAVTVARITHEA